MLKIIYHFIRLFMPISFIVVGSSLPLASSNLSTFFLITSFFLAVQFFDTKWTQEVRILRPIRRFCASDANARTLELPQDLLV